MPTDGVQAAHRHGQSNPDHQERIEKTHDDPPTWLEDGEAYHPDAGFRRTYVTPRSPSVACSFTLRTQDVSGRQAESRTRFRRIILALSPAWERLCRLTSPWGRRPPDGRWSGIHRRLHSRRGRRVRVLEGRQSATRVQRDRRRAIPHRRPSLRAHRQWCLGRPSASGPARPRRPARRRSCAGCGSGY